MRLESDPMVDATENLLDNASTYGRPEQVERSQPAQRSVRRPKPLFTTLEVSEGVARRHRESNDPNEAIRLLDVQFQWLAHPLLIGLHRHDDRHLCGLQQVKLEEAQQHHDGQSAFDRHGEVKVIRRNAGRALAC